MSEHVHRFDLFSLSLLGKRHTKRGAANMLLHVIKHVIVGGQKRKGSQELTVCFVGCQGVVSISGTAFGIGIRISGGQQQLLRNVLDMCMCADVPVSMYVSVCLVTKMVRWTKKYSTLSKTSLQIFFLPSGNLLYSFLFEAVDVLIPFMGFFSFSSCYFPVNSACGVDSLHSLRKESIQSIVKQGPVK